MRRQVAVLLLVVTASCASDQKLVQDALAARHYHDGRYWRECCDPRWPEKCVQIGPPTACDAFRKLVNDADLEANLANATQKIGKLPPSARKRLKELKAAMERQP